MIKGLKSVVQYGIVLFLILWVSCVTNRDQNVKMDSQLSERIDSLLGAAVMKDEIPGAVAYVTVSGKEVYNKAFGWRNIGSQVPLLENDIFRIASMTKGLTAVAILQLNERGLLQLDDELNQYIPEFKNPQILLDVMSDSTFTSRPARKEITIRQLLTHTSGIGYGFQDERYNSLVIHNNICDGFGDDNRTSIENIQRIADLPLLFEPGEHYVYGMSYDVLGVVIELISGMRFDRYIKQYILDPLGMKDSYFILPEAQQYRLVTVYQPKAEGEGIELSSYPYTIYPVVSSRQFFSGGADLCSTVEDYSKFLQMLLNGGKYKQSQILEKVSVDVMLSKQTPFDDGEYHQGFGAWVINKKGTKAGPMGVGSFEFGGFFDTYSWADPGSNLTAVLLLQMYPSNKHSIHKKFQNAVYGYTNE